MTTPTPHNPQSKIHNPQSPHPLHALIIRLIPTTSGRLPATASDLAHAAFLNILHHVDPTIAEALHNHNGRKPFTLSPLYGYERLNKTQLQIHTGQEGWLRLTLFDPVLFKTFINYFLHGLKDRPTIQLNNLSFLVTEILTHPDSHTLAGYTTLDQLARQANKATTIPLHFATPTTFSMRGDKYRRQRLLPDSKTVFKKLAYSWDQLTGQKTMEAVAEYTKSCGLVKQYNLQTQMMIIKKNPQVGFSGHVTYQFKDKSQPDMIAHLNRLADLAFYTGVGSRTTMGMGQVRRKDGGRR